MNRLAVGLWMLGEANVVHEPIRYAHSLPGRPLDEWELLDVHLPGVADLAAEFAQPFGWGSAARIGGLLHDIGKTSAEFQAYIHGEGSSPDHSTAGAVEAVKLYGPRLGKMLAFIVAGHHSGLADGIKLTDRLRDPSRLPDYCGWEAYAPPPPAPAPTIRQKPGAPPGFSEAFLTRMLFSCLVDADFLQTETFYGEKARGGFAPVETLARRLAAHLAGFSGAVGPVNRLRAEVLAHATVKAELPPGLFTLTVPTGGGKTLTSLSFGLEHARRHGLRRVVYVIPYTSIIEQTAQVFRGALDVEGEPSSILEHHASFDWEAELPPSARPAEADDGQGAEGLAKLRRAAENWDAPVVVTTAVQFFESLFANRTSRCRKLHSLAQSVIVLDEAQTLPLPLLRPCLAALDELARNYGASVVLCTATQPALRLQDGFKAGLSIPDDRELAPDPPALYAALKRVALERRAGPTEDAAIAARFAEAPQMLCIVNSRAHARDLFALIRVQPGAVHLTTLMCPAHRREVLAGMRERLTAGEPVRLVATSLIEAGVDIDFPEVWRAVAALDSIAQAAGRCNREGRRDSGRVVVFTPAEHKPPHALRAAQGEAEGVIARHSDPLTLEAVTDYFRQLYWTKGEAAFDRARLDGADYPILPALKERARSLDFPFESIARAFRMIDQAMEPVIVPWDQRANVVLDRIKIMDRPLGGDLRILQQYIVPVPRAVRAEWLAVGAIAPVHRALGEALLAFPNLDRYDRETGLQITRSAYMPAELLVIS